MQESFGILYTESKFSILSVTRVFSIGKFLLLVFSLAFQCEHVYE